MKICTLLLALFFIIPPTPYWLANAQASFYKYVDKNGSIHFTDNLDSIPQEYRNQIKVYREEEEKPEPALLGSKGVIEEQGRQLKESEGKKEAEARALQEKADREEKLKEQKEIQDRIADFQEQIKGKQEEAGSLRTSGMVDDHNRVNQLNAEIAALDQEIESLYQELANKEREPLSP